MTTIGYEAIRMVVMCVLRRGNKPKGEQSRAVWAASIQQVAMRHNKNVGRNLCRLDVESNKPSLDMITAHPLSIKAAATESVP